MTCEEARLVIADDLSSGRSASAELEGHLAGCESCRADAASVRDVWMRLGEHASPQPAPWVSTRFYAALDAYQQGARENKARRWSWWPSRPIWQVAISGGCLAAGLLVGSFAMSPKLGPANNGEIAELRKEMTGMRQLVTLSLLQQQSATERLQGVNWSYRAEPNDMEVLSALMRTINQDSSVDVRLAAVDALRNFSNSSVARRGLVNSLTKQSSPLVQLAIVEALMDLRERSAAPAIRQLMNTAGVDENVRRRATEALTTFQ